MLGLRCSESQHVPHTGCASDAGHQVAPAPTVAVVALAQQVGHYGCQPHN